MNQKEKVNKLLRKQLGNIKVYMLSEFIALNVFIAKEKSRKTKKPCIHLSEIRKWIRNKESKS